MSHLPFGFHEWRWFRKWKSIRKDRLQRSEEVAKLQDSIARGLDVDELRFRIVRNAKDIRNSINHHKLLMEQLQKKKGKWPWDYNKRKELEARISKEND